MKKTLLELHRKRISGAACDGALLIDGERVCDTAENAQHRIPPGLYQVEIRQDKHAKRKLPTLLPIVADTPLMGGRRGHLPTLQSGHGIHTLTHGEILVGDRLLTGVVNHSRDAFETLYNRIRHSIARGNTIRLLVNE